MSSRTRAKSAAAPAPTTRTRSTRSGNATVDTLSAGISTLSVADAKPVKRTAIPKTKTASSKAPKVLPDQNVEEVKSISPAQHMRTINAVLSFLTNTLKAPATVTSGTSGSPVPGGSDRSKSPSQIRTQVAKASAALASLRATSANTAEIPVSAKLNVEKAASTMCGLLVELKQYDLALMELISLSSALRQLCSKDVTNLSIQSPHEALRIPLPPLEQQTPDLAILMMTTQFQLLATLLRAAADTATNWKLLMSKLASILLPDSKDTVIQWKQDCQDIKKADVLLMSIYSLILKSTATLEALEDKPDSLQTLQVRLYACACFSNTSAFVSADSPDEMDKKRIEAYWDQVKKVVVLYFRSEGLLNGPVKIFDATAFLSLFESFTHLAFLPQHEKHFQVINQTLLQIGRRLDNLQLVEFVSRTATTSTESGVPATAESDLLSSSMLLDRWRKSSAPFPAENLLRVCGWIEEFACAGSANLERLRSAAFKGLKEKNEVSKEERDVLCKVLDMLSACVEKFPRPETPSEDFEALQGGAIDTLLHLARLALPISSNKAYDYLSRTTPLITTPSGQLHSFHFARCVSTAFYNMGGMARQTLDGTNGDSTAVRFVRRSCTIAQDALEVFPGHADSEALHTSLINRLEFLASCLYGIGDKQDAFETYVHAITSRPASVYQQFDGQIDRSCIEEKTPALSKSIKRSSRIAVLDLMQSAAECSIAKMLPADAMQSATIGLLLEEQIAAFDQSLHKKEAQDAVSLLLAELEVIYSADMFPLRRARTLVAQLDLSCNTSRNINPDHVLQEIITLTAKENFGQDAKLACEIPHLIASAHISVAQLLHEQSDCSPNRVFAAAQSAIHALDSSLPDGSPSKILPEQAAPAAISLATPKTPRVKKAASRTLQDLKTPPQKSTRKINGHSGIGETSSASCSTTKFLDQLGVMSDMLQALGHTALRIDYLRCIRKLAADHGQDRAKFEAIHGTAFISSSVDLAQEYLQLGLHYKAGSLLTAASSHASRQSSSFTTPPELETRMFLAIAEHAAHSGDALRCERILGEAQQAYEDLLNPGHKQVRDKITHQVASTAVLGAAYGVNSSVQLTTGGLHSAITNGLQSVKLYGRAIHNLSRLTPSTSAIANTNAENPLFEGAEASPELPALPPAAQASVRVATNHNTRRLGLSLVYSLIMSHLRLSHLYVLQGSPKPALYFISQAISIAQQFNGHPIQARALCLQADVQSMSGQLDEAVATLNSTTSLNSFRLATELLQVGNTSASLQQRAGLLAEADAAYSQLTKNQQLLSSHYLTSITPATSPSSKRPFCILPSLQAHTICQRTSILLQADQLANASTMLSTLTAIKLSEEDQAERHFLSAKISLDELYASWDKDPVLALLHDSPISFPAIAISSKESQDLRNQKSMARLTSCCDHIDSALRLTASKAMTHRLQDYIAVLVACLLLKMTLSRDALENPQRISSLLDWSANITLQREQIESVNDRATVKAKIDSDWLTTEAPLKDQSRAIISRHSNAKLFEQVQVTSNTALPESWTVVHISVSELFDCMFVSRHRHGQCPVVVRLPFDRLGRREEEEELFTYQTARMELLDIIHASNASSQRAKHVDGAEARQEWWTERRELDGRLGTLLDNVEKRWLGIFKMLLMENIAWPGTNLQEFKTEVADTLKRHLIPSKERKANHLKLDSGLLDLFANISPTCDSEELEDWLHFVIESCQFAGIQVNSDETDYDQVVCDLRAALEQLHNHQPTSSQPDHLFLILDKQTQLFPWESICCLQSRSISRIPSLAFLQDRIDLAETRGCSPDRFELNAKKASFLLNPGGDLVKTQKEFEGWLGGKGWQGIVGRAPMEIELQSALKGNDVFFYFGHGGAEQYIRSQTIRQLDQCAATFLFGCSSGALKELGDFDPTGTPWNYMIAGCPTLVANLWDVTDKDIDRFTKHTFSLLGLNDQKNSSTSIPAAIAQSRSSCTMRYLNGAAPVVFGIPSYLMF